MSTKRSYFNDREAIRNIQKSNMLYSCLHGALRALGDEVRKHHIITNRDKVVEMRLTMRCEGLTDAHPQHTRLLTVVQGRPRRREVREERLCLFESLEVPKFKAPPANSDRLLTLEFSNQPEQQIQHLSYKLTWIWISMKDLSQMRENC